jgi:hypothetical protein
VIESNAFSEKPNSAAGARMTKTLSQQTAIAARGSHKTHSKVYRGTLSGPIWPQEAENFSSLHSQAESVKGAKHTFTGEAPILFRNIVELKHDGHRRLF